MALAPWVLGRLRRSLAEVLYDWWERLMGWFADRTAPDDPDVLTRDVAAAVTATLPAAAQALQTEGVVQPLADGYGDGRDRARERLVEMGIGWRRSPPEAIAYARARAAEMVGMRRLPTGLLVPNPDARWRIDETTRAELQQMIVRAVTEEGVGYRDLAAWIAALPAFSGVFGAVRAEMIARTELALAANAGAVEQYAAADVAQVEVLDNPLCPICGPVAGTIQSLDWARENPLGHPHCIRSFAAVRGQP
jgi:hypothetical protein